MGRSEPAILIVDDDPDVCHNMSDILSDRGYRVDTAHEGRTVLRLVQRQAYDLALLDFKMPGMDGLAICRELTRLHPEIVALLITAYPADVAPAEARAVGVRQVVPKPIDVPRLLERIEDALGAGSPSHRTERGPTAEGLNPVRANPSELRGEGHMGCLTGRLVVGERVIYRRLVAVFDDPTPGRPRTGYFEVLEGMAPFLSTVSPYRLALDDGRSQEVYITERVWARRRRSQPSPSVSRREGEIDWPWSSASHCSSSPRRRS